MAATLTGVTAGDALFTQFSYSGQDPRFEKAFNPQTQYVNPIIAGYYPDPAVTRKGDKFYLVNSTFAFFPGVPIFESEDLVNWRQIGHVLDRDSQLDLEGLGVSDGVFAPAISYNEHNDTFYMINTNVGKKGNFYVKAKDPAGPWSDPIWLPAVDGIDPSFLFDTDGKAYIVHNAPVMGEAEYEGERSIRLLYFDVENDRTVGEPIEILRRGTHVQEHPIWIEGPHLYHIGDYYYLMCAEGGTDQNHSEVILRAKRPEGPWEEFPGNPILTQRTLTDENRADKVTSTGHADMIQDNDGNWWAVFLGCRPYEDDFYNTGRETFLLPVTWRDGWPVILEPGMPVPTVVAHPNLKPQDNGVKLTGNFSDTDNFKGDKLDQRWITLRNAIPDFYQLTDKGLLIRPAVKSIAEREPLSALFRRQQHTNFTAETELDYTPSTTDDIAGMLLMQNERYNILFGKTLINGKPAVVVKRTEGGVDNTVGKAMLNGNGPVRLKVVGKGRYYDFYYANSNGSWNMVAENVDATNLSTRKAGGFIGTVIGLVNVGR